jgi:membrane-bound lytic murein transglycosylase B
MVGGMRVSRVRWAGAAVATTATLMALLTMPQSGLPEPVAPTYAEVVAGAYERSLALPEPSPAAVPPVVAPAVLPAGPVEPAHAADAVGSRGIPGRVLAAYRHAADLTAAADPGCHLDWSLLAGIGRIESAHASGGRVNAAGTTNGRILGPVLDGSLPGTAVVLDTDGGTLDGDSRFDRATGPMQFLPGTWRGVGADGNGDGVADPDNVDDAALGAARYLCAGGGDLRDPRAVAAALFRYNRSAAYGADVLAWAQAYRTGATPVPGGTGPVPAPVDDGVAPVLAAPAGTGVTTTPPASGPALLAELMPPAQAAPPAGPGSAGNTESAAEAPPAGPAPGGTPSVNAPPGGAPPAGTPVTGAPSAGAPSGGAPPSAGVPTAGAPVTGAPVTGAPVTGAPVTGAPVTGDPVTGAPSAGAPSAGAPSAGAPSAGSTSGPGSPSTDGSASPGVSSTAPPSPGGGTPAVIAPSAGPSVAEASPGGAGTAVRGTPAATAAPPAGATAGTVPPTAGSRSSTATAAPAAPISSPAAVATAAPAPSPAPPPPAPACPTAPVTSAASATRALPDGAGLLVRFALPEVPPGCRVAAASLRLDPGTSEPLTVRRVVGTWSAETVAEPASVGPAVVAPASPGVRRWAVTALMPGLYKTPDGGLLVRGASAPTGPVRLVISFGPR